jgi:biopolymer transport protein ExbB
METAALLYSRIGPAGVALVAVAVFAVYLAVKNIIILWLTARGFNRAAAVINAGTELPGEVLRENSGNPIVTVICEAVGTHGNHSDDLRAEVAYLFNLHFSKVMRDLTLLRVIASVSPLLGLLGTLLGLMGVFGSLTASSSLATGTILAAGIWEAIITTIMGLTLAIPALIVYSLLNLKIRTFHLATVEYSYRLMDESRSFDHIQAV